MKRILSSPSPIEIAQLKHMLEETGIFCFVRNEISAGLSGEIPINESTPELWIIDDAKLTHAEQVKAEWRAPAEVGDSWQCPACSETSEAQFTSCWKCGTARA